MEPQIYLTVSGLVLTGVGLVWGMLRRLRLNDLRHLSGELEHLAKDIQEVKERARCERREHDEIKKTITEQIAGVYKAINEHKDWHLEQHP